MSRYSRHQLHPYRRSSPPLPEPYFVTRHRLFELSLAWKSRHALMGAGLNLLIIALYPIQDPGRHFWSTMLLMVLPSTVGVALIGRAQWERVACLPRHVPKLLPRKWLEPRGDWAERIACERYPWPSS
jgi:hypothetical protein